MVRISWYACHTLKMGIIKGYYFSDKHFEDSYNQAMYLIKHIKEHLIKST